MNLEHVFSQNWDHAKAYYYLLQLGHLLMQLLYHNSLHRALAKQYGHKSVLALWGTLKKIPQRLLKRSAITSFKRWIAPPLLAATSL